MLVPHPLKLGVLLLKANPCQLRIGRAERELDLPPAHEGDEVCRDAPPEPEVLAARVFPGRLHSERQGGLPSCTTGRLQKALFHRSNLNCLAFPRGLAERVGFEPTVQFARSTSR